MKNRDTFLVGNEQIELSITELTEKKDENSFQKVCDIIRQRMNEDGHFILPIESSGQGGFQWLSVKDENGGDLLVAFTGMEEVEKGPKVELLSNYISSILETIVNSSFDGILVNPWGIRFWLAKEQIREMFEQNIKFGDGKRIVVENDATIACYGENGSTSHNVSNLYEMEECYLELLEADKTQPNIIVPALGVDEMEISEVSFHAIQVLYRWIDKNIDYNPKIIVRCNDQEVFERYDTSERVVNAERSATKYILEKMRKTRPVAKESDWTHHPMPDCHVELDIPRNLSDIDKEVLRYGNIPTCMEDKWFWYVSDDVLYAYRSWTGNCIYEINLSEEKDSLRIKINHDMGQYEWTDLNEEIETIQFLLNWWTQPEYDYYTEWLAETERALKKKGTQEDSPLNSEERKFIIRRKDYEAIAIEKGKKYTILTGSGINPNITGVMPNKAMEMRKEGLEKGFIDENYKLKKDVVFDSSSASAAFVVGHTVSGPKTWKEIV